MIPHSEIKKQKVNMSRLTNINEQFYLTKGRKPGYHIVTFGCQMNENDSEHIAGIMTDSGFCYENDRRNADVVFFNTCCVRDNAEKKMYGHLGALKKQKELNPQLIIGITGCMVHQPDIAEYIRKTYGYVDLIFGNTNQYKLPEMLLDIYENKSCIYDTGGDDLRIAEGIRPERRYKTKAYVNAMFGCNNYCSYCIVPYVRGRERSRKPEYIIDEVHALAKDGCKEVMILGQNVNSYGKDLNDNFTFTKLLEKLNEIRGIERIRFMTSHPKDISDSLIECFVNLDKLASHIHLPVQSGSTKVLSEMNRRYTKDGYLRLIDKIKSAKPGIGLTTDIIVGFPGESEKDFDDTLDVVKTAEFDSAFTFIYSPRRGTPAADRDDFLPEQVINERFGKLIELQNEISLRKMTALLNTCQTVLVEGKSKSDKMHFTGRTAANRIVNFSGSDIIPGDLLSIKITEAKTWSLYGEII